MCFNGINHFKKDIFHSFNGINDIRRDLIINDISLRRNFTHCVLMNSSIWLGMVHWTYQGVTW